MEKLNGPVTPRKSKRGAGPRKARNRVWIRAEGRQTSSFAEKRVENGGGKNPKSAV